MLGQLALHLTTVVLAAGPVTNPNPTSPVSSSGVNLLLGYAKWGSLIACAVSALVSGGLMAFGHLSNRPDAADRGKRALLWSLGGAAVVALAIPTLNTVFGAVSLRLPATARTCEPDGPLKRKPRPRPQRCGRGRLPAPSGPGIPADMSFLAEGTRDMYGSYRPRRRWLRWSLLYVAGVLAVAVVGLVIEAAVSPGSGHPQASGPAVPLFPATGTQDSPAPSTAASGGLPLAGPLPVVQGRELVNGVYLGFPHGTAGAVSAADYVVSEVFSTLDPDRAAAVMRLTAAPSYADAPQQAAQGAASDREDLGIATSGPVPAGYSLLVQPEEYQARNVHADSATILLLCDFTSTRPGTGTQTQIAVFPVQMTWVQDDWKVASFGTGGDARLAAEPFSSQAASLGWQELLPQESTSAR